MNSDTIKPHLSKYKNQQVTIVSSGDANNEAWLAPSGKINSNQFIQGNNMTKANNGIPLYKYSEDEESLFVCD